MNRPFVRLLLYAGGLSAALWFLHRAGDGFSGALSPTDPTLLVMVGLRHAALVAGWYLAAATVAGLIARLARVRPLVRGVDRLTLPPLRRLLDTSLGLSMLATAVASPAAWAVPPVDHEQPPITMLRLPNEPSDSDPSLPEPPTTTTDEPAPSSTSTSTSTAPSSTTSAVPPTTEATSVEATTTTSAAPTTTTTTTLPPTSRPPRVEVVESPPPAATGEEWTVQRGDHFWSIAERLLTRAWTRPPTDAETDPYWRQLVEANRHRLADRDNTDLLFVGQVLGIPPPPPAPP